MRRRFATTALCAFTSSAIFPMYGCEYLMEVWSRKSTTKPLFELNGWQQEKLC